MELRLLRYFLTVAKEQSFTKAAEQLHITQPTLSRQMAAFEEDLGITIILRRCTMARLSAAQGLLRSASRSKRAKVTFPYLRNSHNKCGCYHVHNE